MKKKRRKAVQPRKKIDNQSSLQYNSSKNRYFELFGLGIIILLGYTIYSNSFDCSFHLDDTPHIVDNMNVRNLSDIGAIWNYSQTRFIAYYSIALNYHFGTLNVWGYHMFNFTIHLVNTCLVYWFTLLILSSPSFKEHTLKKDQKIVALITALLFVSHPLATQSVTYIIQRMASMVTLFYLISLTLYIKGRQSRKNSSMKYLFFTGATTSAILAILTKENAFTLPLAIILVELYLFQTKKLSIKLKGIRGITFLAGFLGFILIVIFIFSFDIFEPIPPSSTNDFRTVTSLNYLFTQFYIIVKYIQLLILPINQNLDHDIQISNSFLEMNTILSFLLLSSLVIMAVYLFKRNRIISFGLFWFFLTLSIESSIIPLSDLIFEHRTYLPSIGYFLILSSCIYHLLWKNHKYIGISVCIILIGSYSILTYQRNKVWKDDFTLWSDVISKSPNKARGYSSRGNFLSKTENKYNDALSDYNKAIELSPNYSKVYNNRGILYYNINRNEEALNDYNKAIELSPNYAKAYVNRGSVYKKFKKFDEAFNDYNKAIELDPNFAEAYSGRGNYFLNNGKYEEALIEYNEAIELNPEYVEAYSNRGAVYIKLNRYKDAISDLNRAIKLRPGFVDPYINRGIAEYNSGNKDSACNDFQKAAGMGSKIAKEMYDKNCR